MRMPETPMNENDLASRSEDQIGLARQVLRVQPVSVAEGKDEFPHSELRS